MASVNEVTLIGNIGKDPEVRYTPSGSAVANMSIATTRSWKDKNSGDKVEETEWHRVVFYEKLAEIVGQYCKKGKSVYIKGRLKTRKWQDKEGRDQYTTEIVAEQMQLLGGRDSSESSSGQDDQSSYQSRQKPAKSNQNNAKSSVNTGFDDMGDDIPF